jgi:hypothetical protein
VDELTFEEFCQRPLQYVGGLVGASGAQRVYRNDDLGIQKETLTKRKKYNDIYSGWGETKTFFFLDGDKRQFANPAELYVAWMLKVCRVEEDIA